MQNLQFDTIIRIVFLITCVTIILKALNFNFGRVFNYINPVKHWRRINRLEEQVYNLQDEKFQDTKKIGELEYKIKQLTKNKKNVTNSNKGQA